jgi:glycosyltransferase involved in cell wall biosynthesis
MLFEWYAGIAAELMGCKIDLINCHSIATFPLGTFLKFISGSKLVYDTHELETETIGVRGFRKKISKIIESSLIKHANLIIVACESAEKWYRDTYGCRQPIAVVRNIPSVQVVFHGEKTSSILKEKFGIPKEGLLFIYQGMFGKARGVEIILQAFSSAPKDRHVVFMGYGLLQPLIEEYQAKYHNIHLQMAVSPECVLEYTRSADVGLSIIEDICLNYRFALPNKLFEYISAGIPVIISDFQEMGKVIDECGCGWKINPDTRELAELISNVTSLEVVSKAANAQRNAGKYSWESEAKILLNAYRSIAVGRNTKDGKK